MNKKILNKVKGCPSVPLDALLCLQGKLKKSDPEQLLKLRNSLIKVGLIFPLFSWKDPEKEVHWLIDGVHRTQCLKELRDMGYEIESIPLVPVKAANKTQAKKFILLANSQYSKITKQGFSAFVQDLDLDAFIGELNLTDIKLNFLIPIDSADEEELDLTIQFLYTQAELIEIKKNLDILRERFSLEKDTEIIMQVFKNTRKRQLDNG